MSTPAYALADWGTTHLRIWVVDAEARVLQERQSADGMGVLARDQFAPTLEATLEDMGVPNTLPVAICGMAGSRQGWQEAPYAKTPVTLAALLDQGVGFVSGARRIHIVSGIADPIAKDVMRGEETQLLGLAVSDARSLVCMPGTHCKWVRLDGERVAGFRTAMTGELFALLAKQSILRHSVGELGTRSIAGHSAFLEAARSALSGRTSVLGDLFSIRARSLLDGADGAAGAASLSGHLIGHDVAAALGAGEDDRAVVIVASSSLAELYRIVIEMAGISATVVGGEVAARNGLLRVARHVFAIMAEEAAQ